MVIRAATWPDDLETARTLLRHYAHFLATNPAGPVDMCMAGYEEELALLSSRYAEPDAVLLLAFDGDAALGCVAVVQRRDRARACEMKRLWTEPRARGTGLGEALVRAAMTWSREHGAEELLLDTVAAAMPDAVRLYRRSGFEETERHNANPVPGLIFMRAQLR